MERHWRRFILTLLVLAALGFQLAASAEKPWPKQTAKPIFVARQTPSLPEALRSELMKWDEFSQGKNSLPGSLWVARVDLNGDRAEEFIVRSSQTFSGGPMMFVFERQKDVFVEIASGQGTLYFGSKVNGYLEIVAQSRAGAGAYTRVLYHFDRTRFQPVRVADYQETEPGGPLTFVRERNPSQFRR